jgi:cell wall-associated NlpC family hydrolase
MFKSVRFTTLLVCILLAGAVHATPAEPTVSSNGVATLFEDNHVLAQIQEVGQTVTDQASELVGHALGFLGVPYRRGGSNADTGFDCSGFVKTMYQQTVGLILPRKAEQQAAATQNIARADLQPGDLVFFNTMRRAFSHVGIYIGDGQFVHSPKPGAEVRIESMSLSYWRRHFDGARRVLTGDSKLPAAAAIKAADPTLR